MQYISTIKSLRMTNIESSILVKSSISDVWRVISKPGYLERVHPFCHKNTVLKKQGDKILKDKLIYINGLEYIREFQHWETNKGYDLIIGKEHGKKSFVKWRLSEVHDKVKLSIQINPYRSQKISRFLYPLATLFFIKPQLKKYLSSVLKGVKWNVELNEVVSKNQFGSHSWFSNKVL